MAKPFYSSEEVRSRLGLDENGVKQLVRDGKLREFRDGGKVFYKSDDVEKLAAPAAAASEGSGEIRLEAADDELPSLVDAGGTGGGTSMLGLAPDEDEQKAKKEGTVISASGIGVFDDDELEIDADPMAKTQISSPTSGDQLTLEGSGSGSGLLDLKRESDDTSLGAELLDEIYPGEEETASAKPTRAREERPEPEPEAEAEAVEEPVYETPVAAQLVGDPTEGIFSGLLVGVLLTMVVAGSVVAGALQGFVPDYVQLFSNNFWFFLGGATLLPLISLGVGWIIGRSSTPIRR